MFLPDLGQSCIVVSLAFFPATGGSRSDSLAHDERQTTELEQVAHDEEERVEYFFTFG